MSVTPDSGWSVPAFKLNVLAILQLPMLKARWKAILGCLLFQYVHGIFTQLVYRRHIPNPEPLLDTGFQLLPVRILYVNKLASAQLGY